MTIFLCVSSFFSCANQSSPIKQTSPVQLARVYQKQDVTNYLVSEKYDGIRAVWKNGQLRTRTGNIIHAPVWFTQSLPNVWLDGELWWQREGFETVSSIVRKQVPVDHEWQKITYMVFDAPNVVDDFFTRSVFYTSIVHDLGLAHIQAVKQHTLRDNNELSLLLKKVTDNGAEGLMLHKATAMFIDGRSDNVLKLKTYMDAEAKVIDYLPGKGKYYGAMGSLLVEYINTKGKVITFKIGTGFSHKQRHSPPPIDSIITFQYHGFTQKGVPRFASFMRERKNM